MAEQSHREEMSAAIRAQRERNAVPRSMVASADGPPRGREPAPAARDAAAAPPRRPRFRFRLR